MTRFSRFSFWRQTRYILLLVITLIGRLPASAQGLPEDMDRRLLSRPIESGAGVIRYAEPDESSSDLLAPMINHAVRKNSDFFGNLMAEPFDIVLAPNREAFTAVLNHYWGMQETECWMVGTALPYQLVLLSPGVWPTEACEHDRDDHQHIEDILTHELAHLLHMRINPSDGFEGVVGLDWFIEGLAVYVADQLNRDRLSRPEDAIKEGAAPESLEDAWSGEYRYGVSGSLVAYLDYRYGRNRMLALLRVTSLAALLEELNVTEAELLAGWEAWVMG